MATQQAKFNINTARRKPLTGATTTSLNPSNTPNGAYPGQIVAGGNPLVPQADVSGLPYQNIATRPSGKPGKIGNKWVGNLFNTYGAYIPDLLNRMAQTQANTDVIAAQSAGRITPIQNQTLLNSWQGYAPQIAQAGQQAAGVSAQGGAQNLLDVIQGKGGQATLAANALNQQINPEYYNVRQDTGQQAQNLVNSINLGGLSGGETAAVERALNASNVGTGNLGVGGATNVVSNAMNFGQYLQEKRSALGQAIANATNFMGGAQTSNFGNITANATSQPNMQNPALSQFSGVVPGGTQNYGFGAAGLGPAGQLVNTSQQNAFASNQMNNPLNVTNSIANSFSQIGSGIGSIRGKG